MVGKKYSVSYGANIMDSVQLGEILDCSVCFERLNETCKVLPCQHTFCKGCLKAIVATRQELRCPECRCLVTESVDKLPGNILLIRLLEGFKHQQTKKYSTHAFPSKIPFDEPCARALFNYEPRDPGDVTLKKGDLVVLIQRVDKNWFIGEVSASGQQGFLPANFVEVINPLPSFGKTDEPLAKGLFDFDDEGEEDLLHFKQGDVIKVLRKVDVNWCEGEIGKRCGIFPLNFVELNRLAMTLINQTQSESSEPISQTRRQPTIPLRSLGVRQQRKKEQGHRPVTRSRSIPRENPENLRRRIRDFGQSSVATSRGNGAATDQTNRYSIEVTSTERSRDFSSCEDDNVALPLTAANVAVRRRLDSRSANEASETRDDESGATCLPKRRSSPTELQEQDAKSSLDLYVALYNYRPQKSDELQLCSGEHYKVLEKGTDGWYKGFPVLKRQQVGMFPGNYVRPTSLHDSTEQATTNERLSLYRRRHKPNTGLNPDAASLVLPRPRPLSEISTGSDQDTAFSPPLTPPLVGAKPPKHGLFRRLSIGKKKDRSSPQTVQSNRGSQQSDTASGASPSSCQSSTNVLSSSSKTRMDSTQSSRKHPVNREKYRVTTNYPPHSQMELELKCGDIVYVTKKNDNGWYYGTLESNGKVGLFPRSFVQKI